MVLSHILLSNYLIILSQHLKDRVRFEVTARPTNSKIPELDPESSTIGVIFITDVFPADDTVLDGKLIEMTGMVSKDTSSSFSSSSSSFSTSSLSSSATSSSTTQFSA